MKDIGAEEVMGNPDQKSAGQNSSKILGDGAKILSYFDSAPVGIAFIDRENLTYRVANPFYGELIGRDPDAILNKGFLEVMPELENQGFHLMFETVMSSGVPYINTEVPVTLYRAGILETIYVSLACSPQFDSAMQVFGISVIATDMTEQVIHRKVAEEKSQLLQDAIELSNLGTWSLDVKSGIYECSPRFRDWIGIADHTTINTDLFLGSVSTDSLDKVVEALAAALAPEGDGKYDVEYTALNSITGKNRLLHSQGNTIFNNENIAVRINGTVIDITAERKIQQRLKKQVNAGAEALAVSNLELERANQQMSRALQQLAESNNALQKSNDELFQYAYVASHDLQEPLRKIRMFSSRLAEEEKFSEAGNINIQKIAKSSDRMSLLITDLLEYSKLAKVERIMRPVNLNVVFEEIMSDFELIIAEKKAIVSVGKLPIINGVALQINQLFYNILGNALKFTDALRQPVISVHSIELTNTEVKKYIPDALAQDHYYDIYISDNGIGFDVKYSNQIFEVFKRLHPKDIYPGSGIGLALARKIVSNLNGFLHVESELDKGSVFHVILPGNKP